MISFNKSQSYVSLGPTLTGVLFLAVMLGAYNYYKQRDDVPLLIEASRSDERIELRSDNSYKYSRFERLGNDYFRGNYEIKDSLII